MSNIIPELVVSNMQQSREFYEMLGFTKQDEGIVDENGSQWDSLALGDAHLWLLREDTVEGFVRPTQPSNGIHLYLSVDDVDGIYNRARSAGLQMNIVKEIETAWYGLRQFEIADPDGYIWTLNTPVTEQATEAESGNEES